MPTKVPKPGGCLEDFTRKELASIQARAHYYANEVECKYWKEQYEALSKAAHYLYCLDTTRIHSVEELKNVGKA